MGNEWVARWGFVGYGTTREVETALRVDEQGKTKQSQEIKAVGGVRVGVGPTQFIVSGKFSRLILFFLFFLLVVGLRRSQALTRSCERLRYLHGEELGFKVQ